MAAMAGFFAALTIFDKVETCIYRICNTLQNKIPPVTPAIFTHPTLESNLSAQDKEIFEHLVGNALRNTSAVKYVSHVFLQRITNAIVAGSKRINSSADPLLQAFGNGGDQHNTGYVGPYRDAILHALSQDGNIREKFALVYVLIKNKYLDEVIDDIISTGDLPYLGKEMRLNVTHVLHRWSQVNNTKNALDPSLKYTNGIPNLEFESFKSWARFDFEGPPPFNWTGTREDREGGCKETSLFSNSKSIHPPLSTYELKYQCNSSDPLPCKLKWYPGKLCYNVIQTPFGKGVPGYLQRAGALEYRVVAGPSGTTSNVLEIARLLGLSPEMTQLLRIAMVAWMVPTNDHSFFEILLGADSYLDSNQRLRMGFDDLGILMSDDITVDGQTFYSHKLWETVGQWLFDTEEGIRLIPKMLPQAQDYLKSLTKRQ
ncbi:hypothetical protein AAMO2058_000959800 [Amorphochlora amoebiformis]